MRCLSNKYILYLQLFPPSSGLDEINDEDLLRIVATKCQKEMEEVERKSTIKTVDVESLTSFDDLNFCKEIDNLCPVLSAALKGASGASGNDRMGPRTLCYGTLFKARYSKNRSCIVAHRNDQLLFAAGAKKKTFKWFNKMGLTNSYSTALRKNKQLSENYDSDVVKWKENIEQSNKAEEYQVSMKTRPQHLITLVRFLARAFKNGAKKLNEFHSFKLNSTFPSR